MPVVVLVADGARVDALSGDLTDLPALQRLRDEGGSHVITTVFPSVTGPAYTPFLLGRYPGPLGVPGIRWYDRSRTACSWPDYARSYVGYQFSRFDRDLDAAAPTIFELAPNSLGALSVVTRGLAPSRRYGTLTAASAVRIGFTHFRGKPDRWLDVDREVHDTIPRCIRDERPDFVLAAFPGVDKASHALGHGSALVRASLALVDATAAQIRADAERGGYWDKTHLWIVSDHGHSGVHSHDDLAEVVAATGARALAHPFTMRIRPELGVMVSGNAMAHIYLDVCHRERTWWPSRSVRWTELFHHLLARDSVDLGLCPTSPTSCDIWHATRGAATVYRDGDIFGYTRTSGDPLDIGLDLRGFANETYDALKDSDYPDAIVQILSLAGSVRSGDIIFSAAPGWDFRARYEPIPHVSSHGSLHKDHMLVPLITNRRPSVAPRRTVDIFASALVALGVTLPRNVDGESFL